jgi:hypothetical protein
VRCLVLEPDWHQPAGKNFPPSIRKESSTTALTSVLSPKYEVFCCDQNGPQARREEGAYLNRYVTDEQRSRRPIFIATLWAGASWLFFRVARSTRMNQIWALRSRLEKQSTDRQNTSYFGDRTLESESVLLVRGCRLFPRH